MKTVLALIAALAAAAMPAAVQGAASEHDEFLASDICQAGLSTGLHKGAGSERDVSLVRYIKGTSLHLQCQVRLCCVRRTAARRLLLRMLLPGAGSGRTGGTPRAPIAD